MQVCASPRGPRGSLDALLEAAAGELGDFLLPRDSIVVGRRQLGEGGFGCVWQGTLHGVDQVAIKVAKVGCMCGWMDGLHRAGKALYKALHVWDACVVVGCA